MVYIITTKTMNTDVFFRPRTGFMSSMLGKDSASPDSSKAKADPLPILYPAIPDRLLTSRARFS